MTKVKITGLDGELKTLRKRIFKAVEDSGFEKSLAKATIAEVRKVGIDPELEEKTVEFRKRVISKKGPGFSPSKSSLTLSGQLLGAVVSIFDKADGIFTFKIGKDVSHKPYKTKSSRKRKKKTSSRLTYLSDILEGVSKDRPLTKVFDTRDFRATIERKLVSAIKRFFK